MSNNQTNQTNPQDEYAMKLAILKKAVLEERKKTQVLQEEVKSMKDIISEKNEQISKLRNENNSLSESLSKKDPKTYYDNLFKVQQDSSQNELADLKAENATLKEKIFTLETDNGFLKEHLDDCLITYQNLQASSTEEIELLKKQMKDYMDQTSEDQNKMKTMSEFFIKTDVQKTEMEEKYEYSRKNNERLLKENNELALQLSAFDISVIHLKDEIERLTISNYQLQTELTSKVKYPKTHLFKGLSVRTSRKVEVELSFSKYKNAIAINYQNEKEIVILMNELVEIKEERLNRILIVFSDYNGTTELRIDFGDNQISFIKKYAEELMEKDKRKKDSLDSYTLDSGI